MDAKKGTPMDKTERKFTIAIVIMSFLFMLIYMAIKKIDVQNISLLELQNTNITNILICLFIIQIILVLTIVVLWIVTIRYQYKQKKYYDTAISILATLLVVSLVTLGTAKDMLPVGIYILGRILQIGIILAFAVVLLMARDPEFEKFVVNTWAKIRKKDSLP